MLDRLFAIVFNSVLSASSPDSAIAKFGIHFSFAHKAVQARYA
jgi:hypothetical protein